MPDSQLTIPGSVSSLAQTLNANASPIALRARRPAGLNPPVQFHLEFQLETFKLFATSLDFCLLAHSVEFSDCVGCVRDRAGPGDQPDRKSTRLNSSHIPL